MGPEKASIRSSLQHNQTLPAHYLCRIQYQKTLQSLQNRSSSLHNHHAMMTIAYLGDLAFHRRDFLKLRWEIANCGLTLIIQS